MKIRTFVKQTQFEDDLPKMIEYKTTTFTNEEAVIDIGEPKTRKNVEAGSGLTDLVINFVPRWPTNPYHDELDRNLREWKAFVDPDAQVKSIYRKAKEQCRAPDVLHLHAISHFRLDLLVLLRFVAFWWRINRLRSMGTKLVWTIHDVFHHEAVWPKIDLMISKLLFYHSDAVIVHSEAGKRAVEHQWEVSRNAGFFVIPHGNYMESYPNQVDSHSAAMRLGIPKEKMVFLFLGLIRPYKGVIEMIREFVKLPEDKCYLVIAGNPISDELSDQICTAVDGRCNITYQPGFVADDCVQDYMNAADVVVFPYTRALTSGALILAMSFGKACIAPRLGALEDTLDERGGYKYDPLSSNGLLEAMKKAVEHGDELAAMGLANKARAGCWTWSETARLTAQVYRETMKLS